MTPGAKRSSAPTVFGGGPGGLILRGSWNAESRTAVFTEHDVRAPTATVASYSGRVSVDGLTLSGSFDHGDGSSGVFACHLEVSSDDGSMAGCFVGSLIPEGEFAEFIPTNPLVWALTVLTPEAAAAAGGCPRVFGGGFFSDAGDVAGHPVLFFALESDASAATGSHEGPHTLVPFFRKTYEQLTSATDGDVAYTDCTLGWEHPGSAASAAAGGTAELWLRGKWRNDSAGTQGILAARRHPPDSPLAEALVLCARCTQSIWPGEPRWACERSDCMAADQPWAVCFRDGCLDSEAARTHPCASPVTPAMGLVENVARGASCGALVLDAFRRFAGRPLLGTRADGAPFFSYRSYAEVGAEAVAAARALSAAGVGPGSFTVLYGDSTPESFVATLACVVAGTVLVPLSASLSRAALLHVLAKTAPAALIVDAGLVATVTEAAAAAGVAPGVCWVTHGRTAASGGMPRVEEEPAGGWVPFFTAASATTAAPPAGCAAPLSFPVGRRSPESLVAVLFTSGSTGAPKGAAFSEELALPTEGVSGIQPFVRFDFQVCVCGGGCRAALGVSRS